MRRVRTALTLLLVGATVAACTSNGAKPSGAISTVSPAPATAIQAGTGSPTANPTDTGCDNDPWHAAPIRVTHTVTAPPAPVVTAIRPGSHPDCGYDRVTFDITGPVPSYTVDYIDQVVADGSGNAIALPGQKFLLITLEPAQGHDASGTAIAPQSATTGYPMLKGYAVAGDSEGIVTIALGLADTAQIRTGELAGRLFVDVKS